MKKKELLKQISELNIEVQKLREEVIILRHELEKGKVIIPIYSQPLIDPHPPKYPLDDPQRTIIWC